MFLKYAISDSQKTEFRRNGHILLRGVADPNEIETFRPAILNTGLKNSTETRKLEERSTYARAFLQVTNLWQKDEVVKEFVFSRKYAQIAADLLGVEKVRLYHDQALFKEPGGGHTPWHQDQFYWPLDTTATITMWMPLVNIEKELGMLTFATGSHHQGPIGNIAISDESETVFDAFIRAKDLEVFSPDAMSAGDATFHLGWTIHGAGGNDTNRMREVMTVIYFADGAKISHPANENQILDLETWLGGKSPGEFADSELNPVLN